MSNVIRFENISKQYRLGQIGTGALSHDLQRAWSRLRGKPDPFAKVGQLNDRTKPAQCAQSSENNYTWALRNVTLDIKRGEILGIIGRNGAGKSTLLKLLSRVTAPTAGSIKTKGRIASLLEVGTGFHPELTGRENVFLNGAILGMRRIEIARRLDEIIEFSGCAKYIDTPVKRYSSGMMVRLGFSVAAHLECEILVVDEVLAVGDAEFQKKCVGKLNSMSSANRTVIFVSHQLNMVESLCDRVCIMDTGTVTLDGTPSAMIAQYSQTNLELMSEWIVADSSLQSREFSPTRIAVVGADLAPLNSTVTNGTQIGLLIEGETLEQHPALKVGFAIYGTDGQLLFWTLSTDSSEETWPQVHVGPNSLICWLPEGLFNHGTYHAHLIIALHQTTWISQPLVNAPVVSFQIDGQLSNSPLWQQCRPGVLAPALEFTSIR
jgi:lipopolysaccharide transport system ATP-binding protein